VTLRELSELGVGFISVTEAFDLTTPTGRPLSAESKSDQIQALYSRGLSKSEVARLLGIGRTSVRRLLGHKWKPRSLQPSSLSHAQGN
jgi:DNA invertase Pin-like site-specific DNA recombinase